jgi:para-aminobenzoate synthetase component I
MGRTGKNTINRMNRYGREKRAFVFIIDFSGNSSLVVLPEQLESQGIRIALPGLSSHRPGLPIPDFFFKKFPVEFGHYERAFNRVKDAIQRGDTFLLNLTFPTRIDTNLTLNQIFDFSRAKYKLLYQEDFVVFSPEPFIRVENNIISTFPMKGTVDAAVENAEKVLLEDIKELAEHYTIVDLLRNDLSMVAKKVRVEQFRFVEQIKTHDRTLLQTSSKITGELQPGWQSSIGDIIFALLPAGSVSGAPKKKTVELIREAETYERGYFTGIFGYFDGNNLDSAVMIRFIERKNGRLWFKSGGGITSFSSCEKEYQELVQKVYLPIFNETG